MNITRKSIAISACILVVFFVSVVFLSKSGHKPQSLDSSAATLSSQDIGPVNLAGSMSVSNDVYTITASGTDIWSNADGFRYSYQPLNGDGTVVARIVSAQQVDDFTLAGVMIRESLNADARHAAMLVSPSGRAKFRFRANTGGASESHGPGAGAITLPRWVKLTRQGSSFTGSISADGNTWQTIKSSTVAMGANVHVGIAVTSHNNNALTTAVVDSYSVVSASTPTPTSITESPNNTRVPPAAQIVDSVSAVWTRTSNGAILRNGLGTAGEGSQILYCNRIVYVFGTDSQWWKWNGGWTPQGTTDPCGAQAPAAPSATAPTNINSNSFKANWSASSGATGYRLDVGTDLGFNAYVSGYQNKDVGNVLNFNVAGLNPNTTYTYRVRAYNAAGTSGNSSTIVATTTAVIPPAAPVATAATNVTTQSFTTNWTGSSGVTGYRLDVATDSAFTNFVSVNGGIQNKDVGNTLSYKVDFLASSFTFYYRVRAYNSNGTSSNSNVISVTTLAAVPPPAPTSLPATNITQNGFTANWLSSDQATGYEFDVSTNQNFTTFVIQNLGVGNALSGPVSSLNPGVIYYWRVRAHNSFGRSVYSETKSVTTVAATAPSTPVSQLATDINSVGFTAHWSLSTGARDYDVEVSLDPNFGSFGAYRVNGNVSFREIAGLKPSTTYYWRVKALNDFGRSANSEVRSVTTSPPTIMTYKASTDFSSTQGFRNWWYYYYKGGLNGMNYNSTSSWWVSPLDAASLIWSNGQHPGTYNSVRVWQSPGAGTVTITGSASDGNSSCGSGVIVSIFKGTPSNKLWQLTIPNGGGGGNYNINTSVKYLDIIGFMVDKNGDVTCDSTNFDPTIQFNP